MRVGERKLYGSTKKALSLACSCSSSSLILAASSFHINPKARARNEKRNQEWNAILDERVREWEWVGSMKLGEITVRHVNMHFQNWLKLTVSFVLIADMPGGGRTKFSRITQNRWVASAFWSKDIMKIHTKSHFQSTKFILINFMLMNWIIFIRND